jgi:predicted nucleic acid-binding protein
LRSFWDRINTILPDGKKGSWSGRDGRALGNILHDVHAVLMREHGIRDRCTRDAEFSRFPFLRVIGPVAS